MHLGGNYWDVSVLFGPTFVHDLIAPNVSIKCDCHPSQKVIGGAAHTVRLFYFVNLLDTGVLLCCCLVRCCVAELAPHFTRHAPRTALYILFPATQCHCLGSAAVPLSSTTAAVQMSGFPLLFWAHTKVWESMVKMSKCEKGWKWMKVGENPKMPYPPCGRRIKTYARGNNDAPSITKYGSPVRLDAQIVALHPHCAKGAPTGVGASNADSPDSPIISSHI